MRKSRRENPELWKRYRRQRAPRPDLDWHNQQGKAQWFDRTGLDGPYWTEERIIRFLQEWAKRRGRAPKTYELERHRPHHGPEENAFGEIRSRPCAQTIKDRFGTFTQGLRAAGLEPAPRKRRSHCKRGHLLEGSNLYVAPDGTRQCRICRSILRRRAREERGWV
jgi:hypothetical protein